MNINVNLIKVKQPIGIFYIGALEASTIVKISTVNQRNSSAEGVQRKESQKRINDITNYCNDPDATFPTPIILSVEENDSFNFDGSCLSFNEKTFKAEVIDGQHRILGLKSSNSIEDFELPVIFMFGLTVEEKAYVFSTINSTQKTVPKSLIYDLFDLFKDRSPQKTCHEIARAFNSEENSPFYNRLKMLGEKKDNLASLSQGTFITHLLRLITSNANKDAIAIKNKEEISDNSNKPLRYYFKKEEDEKIYKILFNLFSAVSIVFSDEWNNPDKYILTKTIGYAGIIKAFPELYRIGLENKRLNREFFIEQFNKVKNYLNNENIELTIDTFKPGALDERRWSEIIKEAINQ